MMRREQAGYDINDVALSQGSLLNGRYRIQETYYWGHISISYLCEDLTGHGRVMIKEFCPYEASNRDLDGRTLLCRGKSCRNYYEQARLRFQQECNIVQRVSGFTYPYKGCTPTYVETFYENQSIYLVIQYVEGVSLLEALKEKREINEFKIMRCLIEIISEIQKNGILHRDIKPANLIVREDGKITVIDFGAACYENETESPLLFVSRGYSAPELYDKQNGTRATDIYSIGCLMYYLLTGYQLPAADDMEGEEIPPVSEFRAVNKELDEIVLQMLDRNPDRRYQNLDYLKDILYFAEKQ